MTREAQREGTHEPQRGMLEAGRHAREGRRDRLHSSPARLSDADLLRRVVVLAAAEREATVELVAHLAELDARRLYLGQGYSSLFGYCTGALRLAEHAAFNRIQAARASREFPAILDLLADGSLNLSTVRLIAPHLRADNFEAVVTMAKGRSKREVEELVARLAPRPDMASSVRKLPAPVCPAVTAAGASPTASSCALLTAPSGRVTSTTGLADPLAPDGRAETSSPVAASVRSTPSAQDAASPILDPGSAAPDAPVLPGRPAPRPVVAPLAPGRYRVQFTVDEDTHDKLRRAQDLLRREIPDGDPGAIFDRALTLLLQDVARRKLAETTKPRAWVARGAGSRHMPARVKRAVWLRDGGRCTFVAANGRRCAERAFLEFHHEDPYAIGGEATENNVALRCRGHNAYEAELAFGRDVISAAISAARTAHVGGSVPAAASTDAPRARDDAPRTCTELRRDDGATRDSPRGESDTSRGAAMRSWPQAVVADPMRPSAGP